MARCDTVVPLMYAMKKRRDVVHTAAETIKKLYDLMLPELVQQVSVCAATHIYVTSVGPPFTSYWCAPSVCLPFTSCGCGTTMHYQSWCAHTCGSTLYQFGMHLSDNPIPVIGVHTHLWVTLYQLLVCIFCGHMTYML